MKKIVKGDEIVVTKGRDKGKRGTVVQCLENSFLLVQGVNRVKKNVKPNPVKGVVGGILEKEMPLRVCNVALINPASQKADRVGFKYLDDGAKVRYFKSNGELVKV
jgi:large subunit ribosomal protein L24